VVQAALNLVLEPIFEADFRPCSYGFRPNRRAHDAIAEIHHVATAAYRWVLDADIEACFDCIDYPALMDRVRPPAATADTSTPLNSEEPLKAYGRAHAQVDRSAIIRLLESTFVTSHDQLTSAMTATEAHSDARRGRSARISVGYAVEDR
jgi:hypothetical protein